MDYCWDKGRQTFSNIFSSPPPVRYHGLLNQGATCYLNSVLQVLFMTGDFREAVERHCCENPATECIDRHLKALFDDLKGQTAYTYNITRKLGIDRVYEQQDAAEYYEKILSLTSPDASQIFHGWMTDRTTCSSCSTETDTDGAFWHLPLALVDSYSEYYSVVDGIQEHFRASDFSGENQMYCEQCNTKSDATIRRMMKHHPEVLMLLLKRFDFDYRSMTYVKINQTVDVPRTLQIPENQMYELYAVVDHSGDLRSGCYTATIWDDENWFIFNDSRVTLANYQPFQVDNFEKSCSAYLLFYRKLQNATQPPRPMSAPGSHQPATGDVYDRCQVAVELQPDPPDYGNDQDTRDEVEILTGVKEGKEGNAEAENQAEEMDPSCGVTQREESVDDQGSGKESAPDVSDDFKPEMSDMLAKDAHLRKGVEMGDEERGVMDVKTGEDKQSGEEEKSLKKYPEDNAGENIGENLRGTQEVGQDYDPKAVEEQKRRDDKHAQRTDTSVTERYPSEGVQAQDSDIVRRSDASVHPEQRISITPTIQKDVELDKKGKTGVHDRGMGSGPRKLLTKYDLLQSYEIQDDRRVDDNKQKMPKDDQKCKEGGSSRHKGQRDVKGVTEHKRGDSEQPHFGQDEGGQSTVGLDYRQRMSEQKISGTYTSHKGVSAETQSKHIQNKSNPSLRRAGSEGSRKPTEYQGAGRGEQVRRSNSQERPGSKNIKIKTIDEEIRSETVPRSSVFSDLRRAGSAASRKPTENQGDGRVEQVRQINPQPKPTLEFPESIREERPGSEYVKIKITDTEICTETVPRASA